MTAKWNEITVEIPGVHSSMRKETLRYRTEGGERVYQCKVVKHLAFYYGSVEETIEYLRRESEGLVDTKMDTKITSGYTKITSGYECYHRDPEVAVLSGWTSDVPEKVIKAAEKKIS